MRPCTARELEGFDGSIIQYDEADEQDYAADIIPDRVDEKLEDWTDHGEFQRRLDN